MGEQAPERRLWRLDRDWASGLRARLEQFVEQVLGIRPRRPPVPPRLDAPAPPSLLCQLRVQLDTPAGQDAFREWLLSGAAAVGARAHSPDLASLSASAAIMAEVEGGAPAGRPAEPSSADREPQPPGGVAATSAGSTDPGLAQAHEAALPSPPPPSRSAFMRRLLREPREAAPTPASAPTAGSAGAALEAQIPGRAAPASQAAAGIDAADLSLAAPADLEAKMSGAALRWPDVTNGGDADTAPPPIQPGLARALRRPARAKASRQPRSMPAPFSTEPTGTSDRPGSAPAPTCAAASAAQDEARLIRPPAAALADSDDRSEAVPQTSTAERAPTQARLRVRRAARTPGDDGPAADIERTTDATPRDAPAAKSLNGAATSLSETVADLQLSPLPDARASANAVDPQEDTDAPAAADAARAADMPVLRPMAVGEACTELQIETAHTAAPTFAVCRVRVLQRPWRLTDGLTVPAAAFLPLPAKPPVEREDQASPAADAGSAASGPMRRSLAPVASGAASESALCAIFRRLADVSGPTRRLEMRRPDLGVIAARSTAPTLQMPRARRASARHVDVGSQGLRVRRGLVATDPLRRAALRPILEQRVRERQPPPHAQLH
ncbi:hypothetical protein ACO2Q0_20870 [Phenylobacterium sp. VNQ135]|uniref:hypothetical protein n=1 Tax=Phenylobacterium sp. VNQ135 TaxID=3400922 RepID=UPI003C0569A3